MIDLAAPIPTGRKPGNPARLVRHPFRVQRGSVMTFDEFKLENSKTTRNGLLSIAWELAVTRNNLLEAYLMLEKKYAELAAVSDFMATVIEKHGLKGELTGEEIEQYKKEAVENFYKGNEVIEKAIGDTCALETKRGISDHQRKAVNVKHNEHKEKVEKIRRLWANGEYSTRNECADTEYEACEFKNSSSARRALTGTPNPERNKKSSKPISSTGRR